MAKLTKKQKEALAKFDRNQVYTLEEAVEVVKKITYTKFDASVDIDVRLGVHPRKANQMVRGQRYPAPRYRQNRPCTRALHP